MLLYQHLFKLHLQRYQLFSDPQHSDAEFIPWMTLIDGLVIATEKIFFDVPDIFRGDYVIHFQNNSAHGWIHYPKCQKQELLIFLSLTIMSFLYHLKWFSTLYHTIFESIFYILCIHICCTLILLSMKVIVFYFFFHIPFIIYNVLGSPINSLTEWYVSPGHIHPFDRAGDFSLPLDTAPVA